MDLVLVIDASGSIRAERFPLVQEYMVNLVNELEVHPDKTRVGGVQFSSDSRTAFYLNVSHKNYEALVDVRFLTPFDWKAKMKLYEVYHNKWPFTEFMEICDKNNVATYWCIHTQQNQDRDRNRGRDQNNEGQ